jgi:hypothetical protein
MPPSFPKFLQGFAATVYLLNVAIEKRAALECIVLQANLIDGLLRAGLVLQDQLRKSSSAVDERLIKQEDGDPMISERDIYKRALKEDVVDKPLFDDLSSAYAKRNKAIHRYLLCGVTYDDAKDLVFLLDDLRDRVRDRVFRIEQEQIKRGVGMTVSGPEADREFLKDFAAQKEKRYNLE